MNEDGGSQAELFDDPGNPILSRLAWKPDGSRILFSRYADSEVWAVDPGRRQPQVHLLRLPCSLVAVWRANRLRSQWRDPHRR